MTLYEAAERFVRWLDDEMRARARGDGFTELDVEPAERFWLGRLAPESAVASRGLGERGERLDPCAVGIRFRPAHPLPLTLSIRVSLCTWIRVQKGRWRKTDRLEETVRATLDANRPTAIFGKEVLENRLRALTGCDGLSADIRTETTATPEGNIEAMVLLVNSSPDKHTQLRDTNLYEVVVEIRDIEYTPYLLEALPDSFRYDRRVPAYGINAGIDAGSHWLRTNDAKVVDRARPEYWSVADPEPDLRFETLAITPLEPLDKLVTALSAWGQRFWGPDRLRERAENEDWSTEMREAATIAAGDFSTEVERIRNGLLLLRENSLLRQSFCLMNSAMVMSARDRYDSWRPFQLGFLLANIGCLVDPSSEADVVDVVWFATGGGKTETYLGLLVTAAFHDRLTGKIGGITAWSRFPLRMLSLQQTQRFCDAFGAAEIVRRREEVPGEPFSVGFFVGAGATPNRIQEDPPDNSGLPDPDDEEMPGRYQTLLRCPFCHGDTIEMGFDRRAWRLEHRCRAPDCPWPEVGLPFFIVDDEIFRFLPTVVVGTLDKAALVAWQAAMRGFVGEPRGRCSGEDHGYVYAPRSKTPTGCLVPGCRRDIKPLEMDPDRYAPSYRLQDELHLLRDSLGAVDAHYEALLDDLQQTTSQRIPKILASSATLTGFERQSEVIYQRRARAFPVPGPSAAEGFWSSDSELLMRRFVAFAPRGLTLEFAVDRLLTELQGAVRRLKDDPAGTCAAAGIDAEHADDLLSIYGTDVVYGNTLRDLDAVVRSFQTQIRVDGVVNTESLTGGTDFERVRNVLDQLQKPPPTFEDRLHVIAASSMMSHGVDIDRLNVMVMLGIPLGTAEFIQTTARVGRRWPAIVFVMHKMGRERDAAMHRAFPQFVQHGDRFIEPIPVTRRSRRVLERTIAGLELARILMIHEPSIGNSLTTIQRLAALIRDGGIDATTEADAIQQCLGLVSPLDAAARRDIEVWFRRFFHAFANPPDGARFPSDASPTGSPMMSLRDVEEQVPIHLRITK